MCLVAEDNPRVSDTEPGVIIKIMPARKYNNRGGQGMHGFGLYDDAQSTKKEAHYKRMAAKLGIPVEDVRDYEQAGYKHCGGCKEWKAIRSFKRGQHRCIPCQRRSWDDWERLRKGNPDYEPKPATDAVPGAGTDETPVIA